MRPCVLTRSMVARSHTLHSQSCDASLEKNASCISCSARHFTRLKRTSFHTAKTHVHSHG